MNSKISSLSLDEKRERSKQAVASLALEDIHLSDEMQSDLVLLNNGEISESEFLNRAINRALIANKNTDK